MESGHYSCYSIQLLVMPSLPKAELYLSHYALAEE